MHRYVLVNRPCLASEFCLAVEINPIIIDITGCRGVSVHTAYKLQRGIQTVLSQAYKKDVLASLNEEQAECIESLHEAWPNIFRAFQG